MKIIAYISWRHYRHHGMFLSSNELTPPPQRHVRRGHADSRASRLYERNEALMISATDARR